MQRIVWFPDDLSLSRSATYPDEKSSRATPYVHLFTKPKTDHCHSVPGFQFLLAVWELGCRWFTQWVCTSTSTGLNVAMAEKMAAGEYEAYLYSVL